MNVYMELRFLKYLMNIKALNYLKNNNFINNEVYKKSIMRIEEIAQS